MQGSVVCTACLKNLPAGRTSGCVRPSGMAHDGCALFRRHHYRKTHQPASTTPSRQSARNWGPPEEAEVIEDAEVKDAMDVDHLAAEDSDEGGLTGECQQVIPGCSCRQFTCNIFPAHCPNAQMMCRLFVDEDKAAAGHRLLEVAPPFHMAAGSEQEEEDQVETRESSGRPGPGGGKASWQSAKPNCQAGGQSWGPSGACQRSPPPNKPLRGPTPTNAL